MPELVRRIHSLSARAPGVFEVIFVDGKSTDGTADALRGQSAALGLGNVRVEDSSGPRGYGADIRRGLALARGAVLSWTHADLQCDLSDVLAAFDIFRRAGAGRILVKGERRGRPAFDRFFTFGMELFNWGVTGRRVSDINAQPKLFPRAFFDACLARGSPDDFSFDLHALNAAVANGYEIMSFPVDMAARRHGHAKGGGGGLRNKLKLARRTASYILASRRA